MKDPGCHLYLQGCRFLAASERGKVTALLQFVFAFLLDETTKVQQTQALEVLEHLPSRRLWFASPEQEATCLVLRHHLPGSHRPVLADSPLG